jgi:murein L,D-transpeptidase YafK
MWSSTRRSLSRHVFTLVYSVVVSLFIVVHLDAESTTDHIVVHKKARTMELMHAGQVLKTYKIALGGEPIGPKTRQGDHRTPEGVYVIDSRNAHSQFHRSLHISYPNAVDKERARKLGVATGGDIYIHGLPNGYGFIGAAHRARDWTDGCIAVTDHEIEEIWGSVDNGTPVEIQPQVARREHHSDLTPASARRWDNRVGHWPVINVFKSEQSSFLMASSMPRGVRGLVCEQRKTA